MLMLGGCQTLLTQMMYLQEPRLDPGTRHPDFSHFRDTVLDNAGAHLRLSASRLLQDPWLDSRQR